MMIAALVAITVSAAILSYSAAIRHGQTIAGHSAEEGAQLVEQELDSIKASAQRLAALASSSRIEDDEDTYEVFRELAALEESREIGFRALDGNIYTNTGLYTSGEATPYGVTVAEQRAYFTAAAQGRVSLSPPFFNEEEHAYLIIAAAPVTDAEEDLMGVLYTVVSAEVLYNFVRQDTAGYGGYGYLLEASGTYVLAPAELMEISGASKAAGKSEAVEEIYSTRSGTVNYRDELGEDVMAAYAPVPGYSGYFYVITSSREQILQPILPQLGIIVFLCAIIILALIYYLRKFARDITQPIIQISRRLQLLAKGDLETPVPAVQTDDELSLLREALCTTVEELNRLNESHQAFHAIAHISGELIYHMDPDSGSFVISVGDWQALLHMPLPQSGAEAIVRLRERVHPEDRTVFARAYDHYFEKLPKEVRTSRELEYRISDGEGYLWLRDEQTYIRNGNKTITAVIGRLNLIQEEKLRELELHQKAETDGPTGLYNKATFERMADHYLRTYGKNSVNAFILLDLDDLKTINDRWGHPTGDQAILLVAKSMQNYFGAGSILGRIGGDEFGLLLKGTFDRQLLGRTLEDFYYSFAQRQKHGGLPSVVSVSMGAVFTPICGNAFAQAYINADHALYHAKAAGKNRFFIMDKPECDKYK